MLVPQNVFDSNSIEQGRECAGLSLNYVTHCCHPAKTTSVGYESRPRPKSVFVCAFLLGKKKGTNKIIIIFFIIIFMMCHQKIVDKKKCYEKLARKIDNAKSIEHHHLVSGDSFTGAVWIYTLPKTIP